MCTPLEFFNHFFTSEVKDLYTETVRFAEQELASYEEYLDKHHHASGNYSCISSSSPIVHDIQSTQAINVADISP